MDSSFIVKQRAGVTGYARDPVPVRHAVATELDPSKTVASTGQGPGQDPGDKNGKQGNRKQDEPRPDHALAEVVVDPENRDLIYRERDVRTAGAEHPDQALLRQRAYRPAAGIESPPPGEIHADIEA
jgi:hypothetical protein